MGKKSYVNAVQIKQVLENHVVRVEVVDGEPTVEIPDELLNSVPLWEDVLEGRISRSSPSCIKDPYPCQQDMASWKQ